MAMRENKETPAYEAKSHSSKFLEKAARMAKGKRGKKRGGKGRKSTR